MLLTLTNTVPPATDLGYLLHKHPARVQSFELSFGRAHVFFPEATDNRCTAALLLDVDPIGLVRNRQGPSGDGFSLDQYVNDRPFAASSFLSVAIAQVFGSALGGRSKDRPELAERAQPWEARLAVVPCGGGEPLLRELFEPLGYELVAERHALDAQFPTWGESRYFTLTLRTTATLCDVLSHLYVLAPVLDNDKHYWVGSDEVEKLLRHGEGWLAAHPKRELITSRYLKYRTHLTREALARLADEDDRDPDASEETRNAEETAVERPIRLADQRMGTVLTALRASGARRVLDLGCGEGRLLRMLLDDPQFERVVGVDVSMRALQVAANRLRLERMPAPKRERLELLHGSLVYRDARLAGFDAATLVEVIEHLDAPRLAALERVVFEFAQPRCVIVTTPNVEYNVRFESLVKGRFRHRDHRFEWTRTEFRAWADAIGSRFGYGVRLLPVGPIDPEVGSPTQMAVFNRTEAPTAGAPIA